MAALALMLALWAASFLLLSPPTDATYPGAIPWSDFSLLRPLIDALSLFGAVATARGVEIKDLAFHLATVIGLLLLGLTALRPHVPRTPTPEASTTRYGQILLGVWALLSLLSAFWSGGPSFSVGQAALYGLGLGWALVLAHAFDVRRLPQALRGILVLSAITAALCVWYYYERNPFHRPGFPLGNPNLLSAVLLPGVIVAVALLAGAGGRLLRRQPVAESRAAVFALIALVPLLWCLYLARGRGALLALVVGLATVGVYQLSRRLRWWLASAAIVFVAGAGIWLYYASQFDLAMARGASARSRVYAWTYAARLWQEGPFLGVGAGTYPRVAGALSTGDRALDPAAFMAELVEHAHNELFEVFTEIGLVGGVTFVAGWLATLAAASAVVRRTPAGPQRWYRLALLGALVAWLADSCVGVSARLPGGAAVLYSLLGLQWAVNLSGAPPANEEPNPARAARASPTRWLVITACVFAAVGAGMLTWRNWSGVRAEYAGQRLVANEEYTAGIEQLERADAWLLDPVRKVVVRANLLDALEARARDALTEWEQPLTTQSYDVRRAAAREAALATYRYARALQQVVPALTHTEAAAARAAEKLSAVIAPHDRLAAGEWRERAEHAWRQQRRRTRYDVETLLVLATRYRNSLDGHVALLRDALRFGYADGVWVNALRRVKDVPGFGQALQSFEAGARPISPQTNLDSLVASMAPETWRLAAAVYALDGDYVAAARLAARAAGLYEPMRRRFPTQYSIAVGEQADYLLRVQPDDPAPALDLLYEALAKLPAVQQQKYDRMAFPFRVRLALAHLLNGELDTAHRHLADAFGARFADAEFREHTMQRIVHDAARRDIGMDAIRRLHRLLCPQYPTFCGQFSEPVRETAPDPAPVP